MATSTGNSTHEYIDDPRNSDILISINGELKPRAQAMVSVFDSGFLLGDGVWKGLRYNAQFGKPTPKPINLTPTLQKIADQAQPIYDEMKRYAI